MGYVKKKWPSKCCSWLRHISLFLCNKFRDGRKGKSIKKIRTKTELGSIPACQFVLCGEYIKKGKRRNYEWSE